ncbi:helix-turn-helix domain-containing protein [Lysobacter sp. A3-1-A15]|uniref:helix-turn-helix domain-containing protein n=1 Tax=Novilysobacter viscosus TaxID=3098602 RepID=UPI002ED8D81A
MQTVLLLGFMQGAITGLGLLVYAGRRNGSHWLSLGVLALSLTLLRLWTHAAGLEEHLLLRRLPLSFDPAIFPLFYLYALGLTGAPAASIRRALAWLLPWALFMGYSVLVYAAGLGETSVAALDAVAAQWHYAQVKGLEDYLTIGINTVLAALVWSRVRRHYARIANWVPERFAELLWLLKSVMALALVAAIINLASFSANHLFGLGERSVFSHAAQAFYVVLVYTAGIVGFRLKDLPHFPETPAGPTLPARTDPRTDDAFSKLQALMETSLLFAEPDLDLNIVAQRLGLTATETSRVIREGAGKNFRAYVNEFRVEAVKRKLRDPDYRGVSVLAISLESGFNSESSFYRVFKAATGLSPTEFRQRP